MNQLLKIRPARPDDVEIAVNAIYLSMGELADYLFGGVSHSVKNILAGLFRRDNNRFSWQCTDIAVLDETPVGTLVSFPGWEINRRDFATGKGLMKICGFFDVVRLALRALSIASGIETKKNEYYIANMAVLPEYQRRGVGARFLEHAEKRAQQVGLHTCSLIVDLENPSAQRLYERYGYHVVYTKTYPGPAENAHAGYHRLIKTLI